MIPNPSSRESPVSLIEEGVEACAPRFQVDRSPARGVQGPGPQTPVLQVGLRGAADGGNGGGRKEPLGGPEDCSRASQVLECNRHGGAAG